MLHVGISSNLRYNILNGTDMILAPMMPSSVFKAYSVIIRYRDDMPTIKKKYDAEGDSFLFPSSCLPHRRSANNVVGGTSAAICQKITGAQ